MIDLTMLQPQAWTVSSDEGYFFRHWSCKEYEVGTIHLLKLHQKALELWP